MKIHPIFDWRSWYYVTCFVGTLAIFSMFQECMNRPAHAVSIGFCKKTNSRKLAKHIFFNLKSGKKILEDLKHFKEAKDLMGMQSRIIELESDNERLKKRVSDACKTAQEKLSNSLDAAKKTLELTKKELRNSWAKIIVLNKEKEDLKKSRPKYLIGGIGIGLAIGGTVCLIFALNSNFQDNGGMPMIITGSGITALGAGLIVYSVLKK